MVTSPAGCDDDDDYFTYSIIYDQSFDAKVAHLNVNPSTSMLTLETGATLNTLQAEGIYYFTIVGTLPDRSSYSWPFELGWTHCYEEVLTPATLINQSYIITTAYADYDAPVWTILPATCDTTIEYFNQVMPVNTWITGESDNNGDGKLVGWETFDEVNKGQYTVTITAKSSCSTVPASYTVDVLTQCWVDPFDIDLADNKFAFPSLIQNVWQAKKVLKWNSSVIGITAGIDCGLATFTIVNAADDSPIDPDLFTTVFRTDKNSKLKVQTNDSTKVGPYLLKVTATLIDYPTNVRSREFEIVIEDICENPNNVAPTSLVDQSYIITRPAQLSVPAYDAFTCDPDYCPFSYGFYVAPALPVADINAITLDPATRLFTYETSNLALEGIYVITVTTLSPLGVDLGISFDYQVTFLNPCFGSVLTIDPAIIVP